MSIIQKAIGPKVARLGLFLMHWGMRPAYAVIYDNAKFEGEDHGENYYGFFSDADEAIDRYREYNADGLCSDAKVVMVLADIKELYDFTCHATFTDIDGDEASIVFNGKFPDIQAAREAVYHKLDAAGAIARKVEVIMTGNGPEGVNEGADNDG